jgi:hypothetical protein
LETGTSTPGAGFTTFGARIFPKGVVCVTCIVRGWESVIVSGGELGATVRGAITTGVANVAGADASVEVAGAAVEVTGAAVEVAGVAVVVVEVGAGGTAAAEVGAGGVAVVVVEVGAGVTAAVEVGVADVCVVSAGGPAGGPAAEVGATGGPVVEPF